MDGGKNSSLEASVLFAVSSPPKKIFAQCWKIFGGKHSAYTSAFVKVLSPALIMPSSRILWKVGQRGLLETPPGVLPELKFRE